MKTTLIINEQHSLLIDQARCLKGLDYETLLVPANGWSRTEMESIMDNLDGDVIFVSPIPYMLKNLAFSAGENTCAESCGAEYPYAEDGDYMPINVYVFCNDKREKVQREDGKIISVIAQTGWYLA
jgi:hypothetical protein